MADQKAMKKRLKVLMQKPENQVCSDCPERQPRWASLIVPPPGSPPDSTPVGAFCCLECSGSHRRLGVHISFVRSINLDSWKEHEVQAMENGGNKKVNAIWEANLQRAGGRKPPMGADLQTRERYIRDKYERRKFYDHQALVDYQNSEPSMDDLVTRTRDDDFANFGPPAEGQISDAARLRAEKKKKAVPPPSAPARSGSFDAPTRSKSGSGGRRRAKKPEPEPAAEVDLLDMGFGGGGGGDNQTASNSNSNNNNNANNDFADFFGADSANTASQGGGPAPTLQHPRRQRSLKGGRSRSREEERRTKSKTPERDRRNKAQQDILSMYNTPGQGFGVNQTNNINANMMGMMNQMQNMNLNPHQQQQQQQQQNAAGKHNSRLAMHQAMQQQQGQPQMQQAFNPQLMQQMFQQNPQMMQQMMQQMGMNPQMMQQMMAMNQQMLQNMQTSGGGMNNGMMNNGGGGSSGMYNMNNSNGNGNMMGMNMMQQQSNQFGGAPMGGGPSMSAQNGKTNKQAAPEKEDPFAQFGMNAFR